MIHGYPTVFQIGHKMIADIFTGPVLVEEKIDGSQFSFGIVDGELQARSHGKQLILDAPEKMFAKAVATVREIAPALHPEWIYRGEYLEKPKHNTLAYDRVPAQNIIIFDIQTGDEFYMTPEEKRGEAERLGLECVPAFYSGMVDSMEMFRGLLETISILGGAQVEGVVVKNYSLMTLEKKVAMGKYVSERFKEVHQADWKERNPTGKDIVEQLIEQYRSEARWQKAVIHLREDGGIEGSPRDIGSLIKFVPNDVKAECEAEIKKKLFEHFWPKIQRGITAGLPEWYKDQLLKSAFEGKE